MIINLATYRASKERYGVGVRMQACSIAMRAVAFTFDILLWVGLVQIFIWGTYHYCTSICFPGLPLFISGTLFILYFQSERYGTSPGKALFGLRVGTISGCRLSAQAAAMRSCLVLLGIVGMGIPFLFGGNPEARRPFQDVWTRSIVYQESPDAGSTKLLDF